MLADSGGVWIKMTVKFSDEHFRLLHSMPRIVDEFLGFFAEKHSSANWWYEGFAGARAGFGGLLIPNRTAGFAMNKHGWCSPVDF